MIVLGIVLSLIGVLMIVSLAMSKIKCRTAIEATVSKITEKSTTLRGSTIKSYSPVFTYSFGGRQYTAKSDVSTRNPDKYTVGQKLTVFTDEAHPENVRYGSNVGILFGGLVFALLGALFIVLSLI